MKELEKKPLVATFMSFMFGLVLLLVLYDMLSMLATYGWAYATLSSKAFLKDVLLVAIVIGYVFDLYLRRRGCYATQFPSYLLLAAYCIVVWAL